MSCFFKFEKGNVRATEERNENEKRKRDDDGGTNYGPRFALSRVLDIDIRCTALSRKNGTANRKIFHNKTRRDSQSRQDTRAPGFLCSQQRSQTARKTTDGTIFLAFLVSMPLGAFIGLLRKLRQWCGFGEN